MLQSAQFLQTSISKAKGRNVFRGTVESMICCLLQICRYSLSVKEFSKAANVGRDVATSSVSVFYKSPCSLSTSAGYTHTIGLVLVLVWKNFVPRAEHRFRVARACLYVEFCTSHANYIQQSPTPGRVCDAEGSVLLTVS